MFAEWAVMENFEMAAEVKAFGRIRKEKLRKAIEDLFKVGVSEDGLTMALNGKEVVEM
jgi:hypothetical protein